MSRFTIHLAAVFNLHNPPYDTVTDRAYKLRDDMRIETAGGEPVLMSGGSRAVTHKLMTG